MRLPRSAETSHRCGGFALQIVATGFPGRLHEELGMATETDSLRPRVALSSLSLSAARTITREDMWTVLSRAVPPGDCRSVTIVGVEWEVDGEAVESPLMEYGELLAARVEMVLER